MFRMINPYALRAQELEPVTFILQLLPFDYADR